jgi:multiple sugar transport system ATP-binding protein
MTMADRIVAMNAGVVEQIGAPLEVYDPPANTFVAGFIGSPAMNMFPAITITGGGQRLARTEFGVSFPLPPAATVPDGSRIIYGIRPEHVRLTSAPDGVAARVSIVEPLGSQTAAMIRFSDDAPELQILSADRLPVRPDDAVCVSPMLDYVHLFDAETGRRI